MSLPKKDSPSSSFWEGLLSPLSRNNSSVRDDDSSSCSSPDITRTTRPLHTYKRTPLFDFRTIPLSRDLTEPKPCFLLNQTSKYCQVPPYSPSPFKLDPFPYSTPSPMKPQSPFGTKTPVPERRSDDLLFLSPFQCTEKEWKKKLEKEAKAQAKEAKAKLPRKYKTETIMK